MIQLLPLAILAAAQIGTQRLRIPTPTTTTTPPTSVPATVQTINGSKPQMQTVNGPFTSTMNIVSAMFDVKFPMTDVIGPVSTSASRLVVTKPYDQNTTIFLNLVNGRALTSITISTGPMVATIKTPMLIGDVIETQADGSVLEQLTFSYVNGTMTTR